MPNRTVYKCYPSTGRGTINTGTTLQVNFGTQRVAVSGYVRNFDTSNDITIKLNYSTNDSIVVGAGSAFQFEDEYIDNIFLTNASGSSIEYQVVLTGG